MEQYIGTLSCIAMALLFFILFMIFAIGKERVAILISGFNSLSKEMRETYDTKKMSMDMRNKMLLYTALFSFGAFVTLMNQHIAIAILIVWLVLFLKEVHFDIDKAFKKYKL